ncbi:hypothetical protein CBM2634_U70008 [Cupriavidus taiwanensis]|uniref:Uncharacterized protein n=1 Tax=Cupriavidus taiwanensis TaxID=164546 RepID=A0A375JHG3_9BURK|nr:hypothetical protein CBM2634_U70008 [Cupriavidus taiwanensis]
MGFSIISAYCCFILKPMDPWIELDEDALRQYIDAKAVFEAWESARAKAAEVRGGMLWRTTKGREYLIRTGVDNKQ